MTSSFLVPPNRFPLSDTVIGSVVKRVAPLHVQDSNFIGLKRLPSFRLFTSETSIHVEEFDFETKARRKVKISAGRRERCRINQAKYRKRQRQHADNLSESIQELHKEIEDLEVKRLEITNSLTHQNVWFVATEYFRHFRHGYQAPVDKTKQNIQLEFLEKTMAVDMTDGSISGAGELLEKWKFFSICHDDVQVQLKRLRQVPGGSLVAVTTVSLTITENTLRQLYPHLVSHNVSPLAERLLNQRLVGRGSVRFDWDETNGRVLRLESKIDLLTPMRQLVGSLENVANVFSHALISPEGRFDTGRINSQ